MFLKKTIWGLLTGLCLCGGVSAQKNFSFGPKVGINLSDIYIDADGISESVIRGVKPALVIGGFAEYRFLPRLGLSAEVLYSRQGSQSDRYIYRGNPMFGEQNASYQHEYKLQYLNVPILLNVYLIGGLAVQAGIQPGFLLNGDFEMDIEFNGEQTSSHTDIGRDLNNFELAIPMGLSYTFDYGFFLDVRYNLALSDLMKNDTREALDLEGVTYHKMKNRVFAFAVGWKF